MRTVAGNLFLYIINNSVFLVVGAQVCLLTETVIYLPGFLNDALPKDSLNAGDLLRQWINGRSGDGMKRFVDVVRNGAFPYHFD